MVSSLRPENPNIRLLKKIKYGKHQRPPNTVPVYLKVFHAVTTQLLSIIIWFSSQSGGTTEKRAKLIT